MAIDAAIKEPKQAQEAKQDAEDICLIYHLSRVKCCLCNDK